MKDLAKEYFLRVIEITESSDHLAIVKSGRFTPQTCYVPRFKDIDQAKSILDDLDLFERNDQILIIRRILDQFNKYKHLPPNEYTAKDYGTTIEKSIEYYSELESFLNSKLESFRSLTVENKDSSYPNELDSHSNTNHESIETHPIVNQENSTSPSLSLSAIALYHIYENRPIPKFTAQEIAEKFGYTAKSSGQTLYERRIKLSNRETRLKPKYFKDLQSIVNRLTADALAKAKLDFPEIEEK